MKLIHLTRDLMFASSIRATAKQFGAEYCSATDWQEELLKSGADDEPDACVIVDLECPKLPLSEIATTCEKETKLQLVGYAPHMKVEKIRAAQESGFSKVVTRGQINDWVLATLAKT